MRALQTLRPRLHALPPTYLPPTFSKDLTSELAMPALLQLALVPPLPPASEFPPAPELLHRLHHLPDDREPESLQPLSLYLP